VVVTAGLEARTPPTDQGGKAAQDVPRQGAEGRLRRERHDVSTVVTESYPRSQIISGFTGNYL
jgi:hypothetical protein